MNFWDLFRVTKILLQCCVVVPYSFLLWMGKPYRYNRMNNIAGHYFGRFVCFVAVLMLSLLILALVLFWLPMFLYLVVGCLLISGVFDLVIMGCRAMLVHEKIKRRPEGVNALIIWEDKSLWDDDTTRERW